MSRDTHIGKIEVDGHATGVVVQASAGQEVLRPSVATNISAEWWRKPFAGRRADFKAIDQFLEDKTGPQLVVLNGGPGHGKSHFAVRYAIERQHLYPGGIYLFGLGHSGPPTDLSHWAPRTDLNSVERWKWVLERLAADSKAALLIYDNVVDATYYNDWAPRVGQAAHVLATTTRDYDGPWPCHRIAPLEDDEAEELVKKYLGQELFDEAGSELVHFAAGLPLELVTSAAATRLAAKRKRHLPRGPHAETDARFAQAWGLLTDEGKVALQLCSMYEPTRLPIQHIAGLQGSFEGLDICTDLALVDAEGRMHALLSSFVRRHHAASDKVRSSHVSEFVAVARLVDENPVDFEAVARFGQFPADVAAWDEMELRPDGGDCHGVGGALRELGQFPEAQSWYERAVAAKEKGDILGRVNQHSLGASLHQVGNCLFQQGLYGEAKAWYERAVSATGRGDVQDRVDQHARGTSLHQIGKCCYEEGLHNEATSWYQRAVAAKKLGDIHERVDQESLGSSLHEMGVCLFERGNYDEARSRFEEAVAAKQAGDIYRRVDHESLSSSLHEVGNCLSRQGHSEEAKSWFERAVSAAEQGDVHGRVDRESLGASLHEVGMCLSRQRRHEEARSRFERAVAAKQQGDIHGRVDQESLGSSLHEVGNCMYQKGLYKEAKSWYERAVVATEKGDVHGRVDQHSLGVSQHQVGNCLFREGAVEEARGWYERAVSAKQTGDVHGRINQHSLGTSQHQVGKCWYQGGEYEEAKAWFQRAVASTSQGDVHGRVNHHSLGSSLHEVGNCLAQQGDHGEATSWYERAVDAMAKGDFYGRVDQVRLTVARESLATANESQD